MLKTINNLPGGVKWLLACLAISTLGMLNVSARTQAQQIKNNEAFAMQGEVVYVPDRRQLRLMTLGYDQTAADIVWIRTLEYFAAHFKSDRKYPWLEYFLEQIISLDPDFSKVYHWAGANVLYGRRFTNDNVMRSNRFYELALENSPDDFEAAYRLGLNYYVELRSEDPEQQRKWREKGLSYLERAANTPGAPARVGNLVAAISKKLGKGQLALQYLIDLYVQTSDEETRATLKARIDQLKAEGRSAIASEALEFEANRKDAYPYVNASMYGLLGEPDRVTVGDIYWRDLLKDVDLGTSQESAQGEARE